MTGFNKVSCIDILRLHTVSRQPHPSTVQRRFLCCSQVQKWQEVMMGGITAGAPRASSMARPAAPTRTSPVTNLFELQTAIGVAALWCGRAKTRKGGRDAVRWLDRIDIGSGSRGCHRHRHWRRQCVRAPKCPPLQRTRTRRGLTGTKPLSLTSSPHKCPPGAPRHNPLLSPAATAAGGTSPPQHGCQLVIVASPLLSGRIRLGRCLRVWHDQ